MAQLTQREVAELDEILDTEAAYYEKFAMYANQASESAVQKLCEQLTDRTREHFSALLEQLGQSGDAHVH